MLFKTVKRLRILYKQKKYLYPLIIILGDPISYKNRVIYIKTKPVELKIKRWTVVINFNILLLGKDEVVLGIL